MEYSDAPHGRWVGKLAASQNALPQTPHFPPVQAQMGEEKVRKARFYGSVSVFSIGRASTQP